MMTTTTTTTMMTMMMMMGMVGMGMVVTVFSLPTTRDVTVDPLTLSTSTPAADGSISEGGGGSGSGGGEGGHGQCNEGLPPPDQPFRVVWNHPDTCEWNNLPLHLDQYGFIFNQRRLFLGEEVDTIYRSGDWPSISQTGSVSNGGLPQLFSKWDLNRTWEALSSIRQKNFSGLAIIDFESWRAAFATNYGILDKYQLESIKLVRQRHPDYNDTMLRMIAEREFEDGARRLMTGKLAVGKALMPDGHWGYYGYPRVYGPNGNTPFQNNKLEWLWRASTGLYPRIYIIDPNQADSAKRAYVSDILSEAVRVQYEFSPPNTPIYPFSNLQQGNDIFFNQSHLAVTLGVPAIMGAAGIVLWGSSSHYYNAGRQCRRLQKHIRTVLGPFVQNLTHFMSYCSTALCAGHGRCVHNSHDVLLGEPESQKLSALCAPRDSRFRDYHCRCYSRWGGACCQTALPSPCQQQELLQQQHTTHSTDSSPQPGQKGNGTPPSSMTTTTMTKTTAGHIPRSFWVISMNQTLIG